jgi:protein phosphatase
MQNLKITIGAVTDRGLHPKRTANEDRYLAMPDRGVFLVADGVGGRRAGQVASQTAVDVFTQMFSAGQGDARSLFENAVSESNRRIFDGSVHDVELEGMATTLAAVALSGETAIVGHIGDSRVYSFDGMRLRCETDDHSEVAEAVRSGSMNAAQAARHPGRNVITRALGIEPEVEADFNLLNITSQTRLLLCSDGITRHVSDAELEAQLRGNFHPQAICEKLKDLCFSRGAEDNLTAVIVDFGDRLYEEEATRPMTTIRASSQTEATLENGSRISVDFSGNQAGGSLSNSTAGFSAAASAASHSSSHAPKKSGGLFSGLLQLLLLALLMGGAGFALGRYYDQLYALIWGYPPAAATPEANQSQADPDFAAARALFAEKRYDPARERFAELLKRQPENAEYLYWQGRAHLELRQFPEAVKNLSEAAKRNDKLPNVFVFLALAHDATGNHRAVTESLQSAVK